MTYITHARTAEELRRELLSDLNRRIENLGRQREVFGRGEAGKARFSARINELEEMLRYWTEIQIIAEPAATRVRARAKAKTEDTGDFAAYAIGYQVVSEN